MKVKTLLVHLHTAKAERDALMYAMKMRSTAIEKRVAVAVLEIPLLSLKRDLERECNEYRHVV